MLALSGHSGQVTSLAFSPDGHWLATAGWDGTVRLWERPAYRQVRCMRTPYDHAIFVGISPDNSFLAMCFHNRGFARQTGFGSLAWTPILPVPGRASDYVPMEHTWHSSVQSSPKIAIAPDGHALAVHQAGLVTCWDPDARDKIWESWIGHDRPGITEMRFADSQELLAVVINRETWRECSVNIWKRGRHLNSVVPTSLSANMEVGRALCWSRDNLSLFTAFESGGLHHWKAPLRDSTWSHVCKCGIVDMSISLDSSFLLLACEDGQIRQWDVNAREVRATYDWKIGTIQCVAYAPDGLTAAAAGDGTVLVWDVET